MANITTSSAGSTQQVTYLMDWPQHWMRKSWAKALFMRLKTIYASQWVRVFPTEKIIELAEREWAEALRDLSGEQIKRAIEYCRDNLQYFPSIAEFRTASGWTKPVDYYQAEPAVQVDHAGAAKVKAKISAGLNNKGGRRVLPHNDPEYLQALKDARQEGKRFYEVDMEFMGRNGWTEKDEEAWRHNATVLGMKINDMYPAGHKP